MNKAYEYRIYPTEEQEQLIKKTIGCAQTGSSLPLKSVPHADSKTKK